MKKFKIITLIALSILLIIVATIWTVSPTFSVFAADCRDIKKGDPVEAVYSFLKKYPEKSFDERDYGERGKIIRVSYSDGNDLRCYISIKDGFVDSESTFGD